MFIHVEPVASASTVISTYGQSVYVGAAGGPRRSNKKNPHQPKPMGATKGKNNQPRLSVF